MKLKSLAYLLLLFCLGQFNDKLLYPHICLYEQKSNRHKAKERVRQRETVKENLFEINFIRFYL